MAMIIKRKESWGVIRYNTKKHRFEFSYESDRGVAHYIKDPLVLNLDLTMKCNMACRHCVAKDFNNAEELDVSKELIEYINNSPFMVIVITGGEPLLPECENKLTKLLNKIKNKGLIIDTNGTITPSDRLINQIIKKNVLLRISWDSVRSRDEIYFRQMKNNVGNGKIINEAYYKKKVNMITYFKEKGINVSVQSVIHKKNIDSIVYFADKMLILMKELGIKKWYLQRFIPSYKVAEKRELDISTSDYEDIIKILEVKCKEIGIECIAKKDKRHNSVFLLVGEGLLYTQSEKPGKKIQIGHFKDIKDYFGLVSLPDHQDRYSG
jgi:MoaA/NifB/PqqE/SkfB family radical SAM enzyme